jgi:alkaline phosphatase
VVPIALLAAGLNSRGEDGRPAEILHHYTLPPFSLENLGFSAEELTQAAANGLPTADLPALGSGMQWLGGNYYVGVSDRGPSPTRTAPTPGRVFPLKDYTPVIAFFRAHGAVIEPDAYLHVVVDDAGTRATGIPNSATEDAVGFENFKTTTPLPFNPNGIDIEDLYMFKDGSFMVVDEYSPSVAIISDAGKILKRYTPQGKTLAGATYPIVDNLPAILSQRRANRGFEAVAVTADEKTAYVVMQSPLGPTGAGTPTRNSRVLRVLKMDISDRLNASVAAQYVMLMSPATDYPAGNRPQDLKLSAAMCVTDSQLLVIERTDEVGIGGAKLVLVNTEGATDISGLPIAETLALENSALDLATVGIAPLQTRVVFENEETPELQDFKLEGLSIINRNVVALSNDNDFGIAGPIPFQMWVIRLAEQLPK